MKFILTTFILFFYVVVKSTPVTENQVCDVIIVGPTEVCSGQTNTYTITNLPPNAVVNFVAVGCCGAIGTFLYTYPTITLQIFETNPSISLCVDYTVGAINCTTCINIVVADEEEGDLTLSGPSSVCKGSEAVYQVNPDPGPNADITFSATNGTIMSENGNQLTVLWDSSEATGEICLTYERTCDEDQIYCLEVEIIQPPDEAVISGLPEFACSGDPFEGTISPGSFPSITWTASNAILTSPSNLPEISGNFNQPGLAEICVTLSVGCNNDATLCKIVKVSPPPNPTIDFTELCGLEGYLSAIDTRQGSTYLWEQVSGPGTILFGDNTLSIVGFIVDEPGNYTISFTETLGNCEKIKTFEFTLFPALEVSQPEFICGPNGYKITFTIDGGKPPVSVNGEEIFQSEFTSVDIPYGAPYSFLVEDSGLCQKELNGVENCPCRNSAGTMRSFLLIGCDTASVVAAYDSNAVLIPGNVIRFVLHTSKSDTLGTILGISRTPVFTFSAAMRFDSVYYISRIVADSVGSNIRLNDPCLQVSKGQPVVFYRTPMVIISDPGIGCGNEVEIAAVSDQSKVSWYWKNLSNQIDTVNFSDPDSSLTNVATTKPGTYKIIAEAKNKGCTGRDTFPVLFSTNPEISILNIECNDSLLNYTITLAIKEGKAPYNFNQITISDTLYKTGNMSSDTPYSVQMKDANGCLSNLLAGQPNCSCFSEAGTMSLDTLRICNNGSIAAGNWENNSRQDINDTIAYILHNDPGSNLGYIYDKNFDGRFSYKPGIPIEQVLFISRVVGNIKGDTVDINDPCLSVAPGQPVIFYPDPKPLMTPDLIACGTSLSIAIEVAAYQNFNLVASDPSRLQIMYDQSGLVQFTGTETGKEKIIWTTFNQGCTSEGIWEITLNPLPGYIQPTFECLPAKDSVIIRFSLTDPAGLMINNINTFEFFSQQIATSALPVSLALETDKGCRDTLILNYDCSCSSFAGSMLQDTLRACGYFASVKATYQENGLLSGDSSFYILHTQPGNIAGNILSISNNGEFGYLPNAIFESVYYISLVNFNSVFSTFREDPCAVVTPGQPVIFHAQPSLIPDIKVSSCVPEADIEITTDGFSSGWKVVSSPSGSSFTFNNDKLISDTKGVYMIEFFSENNWCINVSLSEIILYDGPVLNQSETFCKDTAFIVELSWLGGIGPYTVLNQVVNETFLSSGRIPSGKVWSIDITDARGCSTGELNFTKECNCTSFLGSFEDDGFILCEGENLILQQPENTILSPGQLVYFDILRRENNQDIILATASIGTLFYNPDWLGDTLYIRPVAGLQNTDGSIDRNDPCLVSGNAVLLIWKSKPDWILPETWSVCPGQDFVIPIVNIENQEFTLFYLRNNKKDSIVIKDALFEWTLSANGPDLPEILSVTGSENRFCKKDTIWNITLISALDWNASIKPEFIFTDTTNMLVYFETDLTLDEITNIEWTFLSSDTIVNSVNPELLISSSQTGAVAIEITDKMGCRLNLQTNILVRQTKEKFIFSNIIRNNSVENGRFLIYPQEAIALIETFAVFDRWGNKQFLSENQLPEEFNWQGTCKDGPCPDGVYVFYLKLVDKQGKTYFLSDDITIIGQ